MGGGYTKRLNLSCHSELSTPATPFNIFNIRKCYFTIFLLRSEMMACPRQPACLTPARASDNIYAQPIRAQVSRLSVRVQLIIKKFKIFFGGKTVATIYQIKTKFVNVFGFLYISKCSEFTIFGVKVNLKSVDPKCSYLACRILQISYYLPK